MHISFRDFQKLKGYQTSPTSCFAIMFTPRCLARPIRAISLRKSPCSPACRALSNTAQPSQAPAPEASISSKSEPKKPKPLTKEQRDFLSSAVCISPNRHFLSATPSPACALDTNYNIAPRESSRRTGRHINLRGPDTPHRAPTSSPPTIDEAHV